MTVQENVAIPRTGVVRRLFANPFGAGSAVAIGLIVLIAVIAPLLPLPSPNAGDLSSAMQGPGPEHWLGTDTTGRDILSRLIWGARVNLLGAALAVFVALVLGVPLGIAAGYYRGWVDSAAGWINDLVMALPGIIVLLAVSAVIGPSIWTAMAIFGVMLAPAYFRIVRASVLAVRGELYVDAAVVAGLSDARILSRHVVAVVRAPLLIQGARLAVIAIAIQAGLEFLGIGDVSVPSWGGMLNEGFRRIYDTPLLIVWPSLAIGIVSMAFVLFANALRDALEERTVVARTRRPRRRPAKAADGRAPAQVVERSPAGAPRHAGEPAPLLGISDLRIAYGYRTGDIEVVHGISLDIRAGEVMGLVGESGSGKSQTALATLGLLPEGGRVTAGSIRFDGIELTDAGERTYERLRGSEIAYVPQEPITNLDPTFTIGSQLVVPMRKKLGLSRAEARERALELLRQVGIVDPERVFSSYSFQLSGGMAQRVLIAGAVSCSPRLLIADEPTTALDVTVQAEVLDVLRGLQRETGMAMLMVTHNFGVVADICDRVAVMCQGEIVETGDVRSVLGDPRHDYTRSLLDAMLSESVVRDDLDARGKEVLT
ncbi:dipeptide/oligopeptide/nickel ABC transporter permease/ATP-binding protein [Microbacterium sp.]|uniref:dipeptide/oligopeptide/nickel ABC transporter permease/ATP-binding protein n=1 Tax=Microbacterium sp. TaxID=51671 RepID=UPI002C024D54|nr:dipeptide/oligopeptide/nickel ABC transporter permease/ATP-binding protein [Microbacterium sp.]HWL78667.1 dipeptide/oligopeptide/nickel ABC transporter permease/ATP-binding protein [Microbacterium sp.]